MLAPSAAAAPWRPVDDSMLLEVLSRESSARALQSAARAVEAGDATVASGLARAYVERARREGDPRLLGYAEGLLLPWRDDNDAPVSIQLLQATLLQSRHDFGAALRRLDRVHQLQPDLAQAWLTRATILRVQGRYADARQACAQVRAHATPFVGALCRLGVIGLDGELPAALGELRELRAQAARQSAELRSWYQAELADQLERAGRAQDAEREYRAGLDLDPGDLALRAAYADLLLDQGRDADALALTEAHHRVDALQLRRLTASMRLGQTPVTEIAALDEAFTRARQRRQPLHLREEALFALDVRGDPDRALAAASANWQLQREPIDARVLLRAALAAGDPASLREVAAQLQALPLEDARLAALLRQLPQ